MSGGDVPAAARGAVERAANVFKERFGEGPRWAGYAPGRVNLIGEHTDYNGGFVLPVAIDRYCAVVAGPVVGDEALTRVVSGDTGDELELDATEVLRAVDRVVASGDVLRGGALSYVAGVFAGYQRVPSNPGSGGAANLRMAVASDVPIGAGLSSSAALEVASAMALGHAWGVQLEKRALALLCQRAEHEFAGVPCGIMDHFAAVCGRADHALLIDCRTMDVEEVRLSGAGCALLVVDTRVRHSLAEGAYAARRDSCARAAMALGVGLLRDADEAMVEAGAERLTEDEYRCAIHVVRENGRVLRACEMLRAGDMAGLGALMFASHASLRDDFRVSCEELDVVVEAVRPLQGVHGARMTGAGFGGSVLVLADAAAAAGVAAEVEREFSRRFWRGCGVFAVRAMSGGGGLRLR